MAHRWYVVHVYSGFENKVAQSIREQAEQKGLAEEISQVLVPTEEVVEVRRGAKVKTERKFFPGYVLVKMELTDETWHLVKNTAKVTGFLGGGGRGKPVADLRRRGRPHPAPGPGRHRAAEARRQLRDRRAGAGGRRPVHLVQRHGRGSGRGAGRLKVAVSIFGRATPVELEYAQVEKI